MSDIAASVLVMTVVPKRGSCAGRETTRANR
jgi:hypothetical protein